MNNIKNSCIVLLFGVLSGCAGYVDPMQNLTLSAYRKMDSVAEAVKGNLGPMSEQEVIDSSKENVRNLLKDPNSAQFRNVRLVSHPKGKIVCGEVNGKNSYGGYVGFRRFYASPISADLEAVGGKYADIDAAMNEPLNMYCGY